MKRIPNSSDKKAFLEHLMLRVAVLGKKRSLSKCWLWLGGVAGSGYPVCRDKGKVVSVKSLLYKLTGQKPNQGSKALKCICEQLTCVNPEHHVKDIRNRGGRPVKEKR